MLPPYFDNMLTGPEMLTGEERILVDMSNTRFSFLLSMTFYLTVNKIFVTNITKGYYCLYLQVTHLHRYRLQ